MRKSPAPVTEALVPVAPTLKSEPGGVDATAIHPFRGLNLLLGLVTVVTALWMASLPGIAGERRYALTLIPAPAGADPGSMIAERITDSGQVVGVVLNADGSTKGFFFDGEKIVEVAPPKISADRGSWHITDAAPSGDLIGNYGKTGFTFEGSQSAAGGLIWGGSPGIQPALANYRMLRHLGDSFLGETNTGGGTRIALLSAADGAPGCSADNISITAANRKGAVVFSSTFLDLCGSVYQLQQPVGVLKQGREESSSCDALGVSDNRVTVGHCWFASLTGTARERAVTWPAPNAAPVVFPTLAHLDDVNNRGEKVGAFNSSHHLALVDSGGSIHDLNQMTDGLDNWQIDTRYFLARINNSGQILVEVTSLVDGQMISRPAILTPVAQADPPPGDDGKR